MTWTSFRRGSLVTAVIPGLGAILLSAFRLSRVYDRKETHAEAPIQISG